MFDTSGDITGFVSYYRALLCSNISFRYFFNEQASEMNVEVSYFLVKSKGIQRNDL